MQNYVVPGPLSTLRLPSKVRCFRHFPKLYTLCRSSHSSIFYMPLSSRSVDEHSFWQYTVWYPSNTISPFVALFMSSIILLTSHKFFTSSFLCVPLKVTCFSLHKNLICAVLNTCEFFLKIRCSLSYTTTVFSVHSIPL